MKRLATDTGGTKALVEAGADVNAKDSTVNVNVQFWEVCSWGWWLRQFGGVWLHVQGQTPLDRATNRGHAGVDEAATEGTRQEGKWRAMRVTQSINVCVRA